MPLFFVITDIIAVIIILFLLYALSAVWPPDSPWAPWWQTPEEVCRKMARLAKIGKKDKIYDLGCGSGKALIIANTIFGATGIGVEIDPLRSLWARWNVWRASHYGSTSLTKKSSLSEQSELKSLQKRNTVTILCKNFFEVNLSDATVVYIYLVPNALKRLVPKFMKELKKGTRIVSYTYDLPEALFNGKVKLVEHDKVNKIFLYKVV